MSNLYPINGDLYPVNGDDYDDDDTGYEVIGYEIDPQTGGLLSVLKKVGKGAYNAARRVVPGASFLPRAGGSSRPAAPRPPAQTSAPTSMAVMDPRTGAKVPLFPTLPGANQPGTRRIPIGLPAFVFNATSGTTIKQTVRAQRNIALEKIVVTYSRTGTTATGLVTMRNVYIGADGQFPTLDGVPVDLYGPTVDNNEVQFAPLVVGQDLTVELGISAAPTGTDNVVVAVALQGLAFQG